MESERNQPATKGDVQDLLEAMRDIETHLLKAFHGFAETNDRRLHRVESSEADANQRLAILERRVLDLETKSICPPRQ